MSRIVVPERWAQRNRVEHPPLMMKQLFQGTCGGLRWLETKNLAHFIAKRAVKDGFPSTTSQRKALLGKKGPPRNKASFQRPVKPAASMSSSLVPVNSLAHSGNSLVARSKHRRLVSFDVLDCTFGGGYHTGAVLENGRPYTRVVGVDCDAGTIDNAREVVKEFGSERFRYYCNRMSEIKAMFGEKSFDAVMVDPGPSLTQLMDPERGFLWDDESNHQVDMRYSSTSGTSAVEYLNSVPQHTLAASLASYSLLTPQQSMKMARAIRKSRPFNGSIGLLDAVQQAGNELPEDGWLTQESRRRSPMSWKFFTSLRGIINNEKQELIGVLQQAFLVLKDNGRLVVFTRLQWEEDLVRRTLDEHPHALLCYSEDVSSEQVAEYGHTRHTRMWVATKVKKSSFVLKNSTSLTDEKIKESTVRWMGGMFAGQTHGFPANNFTFEHLEPKERKAKRRNSEPLPFDYDDENDR